MKRTISALAATALLAASSICSAGLTPPIFFQAELAARQATIKGMADRLTLLQSGAASAQAEAQLNAGTEQQVSAAFANHGTTQVEHAVFAEQNAAALEEFLEANPDYVAAFESLNAQFTHISNSISSILAR